MKSVAAGLLVLLALGVTSAEAQKIDSLRLVLKVPKAEAPDTVANAFASVGLRVSNSGPGFLEADDGRTGNRTRLVRASMFGPDSAVVVQITGAEVRYKAGRPYKQLKIDNHAGGNGKKVWQKMVAAAMTLDSAAVPAAAMNK